MMAMADHEADEDSALALLKKILVDWCVARHASGEPTLLEKIRASEEREVMRYHQFMCEEACEDVYLPLSALFAHVGSSLPSVLKFRAAFVWLDEQLHLFGDGVRKKVIQDWSEEAAGTLRGRAAYTIRLWRKTPFSSRTEKIQVLKNLLTAVMGAPPSSSSASVAPAPLAVVDEAETGLENAPETVPPPSSAAPSPDEADTLVWHAYPPEEQAENEPEETGSGVLEQKEEAEELPCQEEDGTPLDADEEQAAAEIDEEGASTLHANEEEAAAQINEEEASTLHVEEDQAAAEIEKEEASTLHANEEEASAQIDEEEASTLRGEEDQAAAEIKEDMHANEEQAAAEIDEEEASTMRASEEQAAAEIVEEEASTLHPNEGDTADGTQLVDESEACQIEGEAEETRTGQETIHPLGALRMPVLHVDSSEMMQDSQEERLHLNKGVSYELEAKDAVQEAMLVAEAADKLSALRVKSSDSLPGTCEAATTLASAMGNCSEVSTGQPAAGDLKEACELTTRNCDMDRQPLVKSPPSLDSLLSHLDVPPGLHAAEDDPTVPVVKLQQKRRLAAREDEACLALEKKARAKKPPPVDGRKGGKGGKGRVAVEGGEKTLKELDPLVSANEQPKKKTPKAGQGNSGKGRGRGRGRGRGGVAMKDREEPSDDLEVSPDEQPAKKTTKAKATPAGSRSATDGQGKGGRGRGRGRGGVAMNGEQESPDLEVSLDEQPEKKTQKAAEAEKKKRKTGPTLASPAEQQAEHEVEQHAEQQPQAKKPKQQADHKAKQQPKANKPKQDKQADQQADQEADQQADQQAEQQPQQKKKRDGSKKPVPNKKAKRASAEVAGRTDEPGCSLPQKYAETEKPPGVPSDVRERVKKILPKLARFKVTCYWTRSEASVEQKEAKDCKKQSLGIFSRPIPHVTYEERIVALAAAAVKLENGASPEEARTEYFAARSNLWNLSQGRAAAQQPAGEDLESGSS